VADQGASSRGTTGDPFDTQAITVNVTSTTQAGTMTQINPVPTTSVFGEPVTLTATVTPTGTGVTGTPTGMVTFKEANLILGTAPRDSSGTASLAPVALLVPGMHTVTASYSGDANFSTSSGMGTALTVTSAATMVTVTSTPGSPTPGQSVTFTA